MFTRIILFALVASQVGHAGGRAGNGFAVRCQTDQDLGLREGYYSLDFLATMGSGDSRDVSSWEYSSERIKKLLEGVISESQMRLYEDFVANVRNTNDYTKARVWEAAPFGVLNLKTQAPVDNPNGVPLHKEQIMSNIRSLVTQIPSVCKDGKKALIIPAVVFQDHVFTGRPKGTLVYKFVPKVLNELEVTDPLQLSYLYIHEWLWDISNNEDRNRRINQLLHSVKIETMSAQEIRSQLTGMGLSIGAIDQVRPKVKDIGAQTAYRYTLPPQGRRLPVEEVREKFVHHTKFPTKNLGNYQIYAVSRNCQSENNCSPWKSVTPSWNDPLKGLKVPTPETGEIILRHETGNYLLLVKSEPVSIEGGRRQKVGTECLIRSGDETPQITCRKIWAPEAGMQALGYLFVDGIDVEISGKITQEGLWLGGNRKKNGTEVRVAMIVPFP